MLLKLPVVAYDIGSIHEININSKVISLVEIFDVKGLANTISVLLNNEEMQKEIAEKGYKRILEMYSDITDNNVKTDILNAYSEVIKDFQTS
jgi:glycosyltransferase involved in cell wall biosynthesis